MSAPLVAPPAEASKPPFYKNKAALRAAMNKNPLMCVLPGVRRTAQPTYPERLWLLSLYLVTGLLIEHLSLLYGPICREAYVDQCGMDIYDHDGAAARLLGDVLLAPPPQPLDESSAMRLLSAAKVEGAAKGATAVAKEGFTVVSHGAEDMDSSLRTSREMIVSALSGHMPHLNCHLTKCDHWEQIRSNVKGGVEQKYEAVLYIPGMCRCSENYFQKMTFKVATLAVSVFLQTVLYTVFYKVLATDWEHRAGCFRKINLIFMAMLTLVLIVELFVIFLIRFMPDAWLISLAVSALSVVTVSFISAFVKAHVGLVKVPPELQPDVVPSAAAVAACDGYKGVPSAAAEAGAK